MMMLWSEKYRERLIKSSIKLQPLETNFLLLFITIITMKKLLSQKLKRGSVKFKSAFSSHSWWIFSKASHYLLFIPLLCSSIYGWLNQVELFLFVVKLPLFETAVIISSWWRAIEIFGSWVIFGWSFVIILELFWISTTGISNFHDFTVSKLWQLHIFAIWPEFDLSFFLSKLKFITTHNGFTNEPSRPRTTPSSSYSSSQYAVGCNR